MIKKKHPAPTGRGSIRFSKSKSNPAPIIQHTKTKIERTAISFPVFLNLTFIPSPSTIPAQHIMCLRR